jgi:hypothetical protein
MNMTRIVLWSIYLKNIDHISIFPHLARTMPIVNSLHFSFQFPQ